MMAVVVGLVKLRVYSAHGLHELHWLEGFTLEIQVGEEALACFGHDGALVEGSLLTGCGGVVLEGILQLVNTL